MRGARVPGGGAFSFRRSVLYTGVCVTLLLQSRVFFLILNEGVASNDSGNNSLLRSLLIFNNNKVRRMESENQRIQKSRRNYPIGAQMGTEQMDYIMSVLPIDGNLLVWGLGNDSPYWHNCTTGTVMFLEDDLPIKKNGILWYDEITTKYPYLNAYKVHYTTKNTQEDFQKYMLTTKPFVVVRREELEIRNFPQVVLDVKWDVILVDAPLGCCGDMGPARFQSLYMTRCIVKNQLLNNQYPKQIHVFVDDYERPIERQFSGQVFGGFGGDGGHYNNNKAPIKIMTRKKGVSNANEQAHFQFDRSDCIVNSNCGSGSGRGRGARTSTTTEEEEESLAATNMDGYWTVLITVNDGYYDFFLNWLSYYKKLHRNDMTVIVVAEDDVVFKKLQREPRIPGTFLLERSNLALKKTIQNITTTTTNATNDTTTTTTATSAVSPTQEKGEDDDDGGDTTKEETAALVMGSTRAGLILSKLEAGLNVLYTDVDTVWLSNPLPYINSGDPADIMAQTDDKPTAPKYPYYCTGFMAIRANQRSIDFLKEWQRELETPKLNQPIFNSLIHVKGDRDLKHRPLPLTEFPFGKMYFADDNTEEAREKAVVVHNNYIVGHDPKKERFQKFNLWRDVEKSSDGNNGTLATLFVNPFDAKPGTQKHYIQTNTLKALTMLRPEIDVIAFSKDPDVVEMCGKLGIRVMTEFETNPHGTPYLRSMFEKMEEDFSIMSHFIGYMNADILFNSMLTMTLQAVLEARNEGKINPRLLLVGLRTNLEMPTNFSHNDHQRDVLQVHDDLDNFVFLLNDRGQLNTERHEDYFIVTPGTFDWTKIPDFVIGRPAYDNWLVDHVHHLSENGTHSLIDGTYTVIAVHQTGRDGNKAGFTEKPDLNWNIERGNEEQWDHGSTDNAEWETRWDEHINSVVLDKRERNQAPERLGW